MRRFLCGTPSALGLAPLEASVELLIEAGMANLAAKSRRLTQLFIDLDRRHPARSPGCDS